MIIANLHPAQAKAVVCNCPQTSGTALARVDNSMMVYNPALAGLGKEAAQAFIPGSIGAGLIGDVVDKIGDKLKPKLMAALPVAGPILVFIGDATAWLVEQANWEVKSTAEGVIKYLPEGVANSVLKDMQDNKTDLFMDGLKDALAAIYYRISPTGSPATDLKQGRDTVLTWIWGKILDAFGVNKDAYSRLTDRVYKAAIKYGAQEYEASAAAAYALLVGSQMPSILPTQGLETDVKGIPVKLPGAPDGNKRVSSVPAGQLDAYLAKLGPNPKRTAEWIEQAFKIKSGGLVGGGTAEQAGKPPGSDKKESANWLPYAAGGAVLLLLLSNRK